MALRLCHANRIFKIYRLWCPRNSKQLLGKVRAKNFTQAASSDKTPDDGEPHHKLMKDLQSHFSRDRLSPMGALTALRRCFPDHVVTQTPESTGILKFAEAGHAQATLDTDVDIYGSRIYKLDKDDPKGPGRLKYRFEFARFRYHWKERDFLVYVVDCWLDDYTTTLHYILYPRSHGDVEDGQSQIVDELITAASQHEDKVDDQIWVYDQGYWNKNHKLWKNVQTCSWENVVLNKEMKLQLISDVEGFFDRKEDYASFAVPWKVS